ncbi:hypothetical protein D3C87_82040 [compost metagenome]
MAEDIRKASREFIKMNKSHRVIIRDKKYTTDFKFVRDYNRFGIQELFCVTYDKINNVSNIKINLSDKFTLTELISILEKLKFKRNWF